MERNKMQIQNNLGQSSAKDFFAEKFENEQRNGRVKVVEGKNI